MAAMQYAGLIGLLALIAVTPSYAQSRTAMPDGHPSDIASLRPWTIQVSKTSIAKAGELSARAGNCPHDHHMNVETMVGSWATAAVIKPS